MFDLKIIENDVIIVAPNSIKKDLLPHTNLLDCDIKFISKEELKKNSLFDYDDRSIAYLIKKGFSYSNAKELIENLYFLDETKRGISEKIDSLLDIYNELIERKLLYFNPSYKYLFSNKKVLVYGYSRFDKELVKLLDMNLANYLFVYDEEKEYEKTVYKYSDIEDEVDEAFNNIALLVDSGVSIDKIKLYSYSEEYDLVINRYKEYYDLPINFESEMKLSSSFYFKEFLSKYDESNLLDAFKDVCEKIKVDNYHFIDKLKKVIIDVNGLFDNRQEERKYLIESAKSVKLINPKYLNGIDIVDYHDINDDYIFILGFDLLNFPFIHKDKSYLSDKDKALLEINDSTSLNLIEKDLLVNFIKSHSHLHLSYKEKIGKVVYYPSLLIEELNLKEVKNKITLTRYSETSLKMKLCKELDVKENYGIESKYEIPLDILDYKTYDHSYKGLTNYLGLKHNTFSVSKIESYNKCPFSYYVDNILNLSSFTDSFNATLGTFYHAILEKSVKEEVNLQDYSLEIDSLFDSYCQKHFAKKLLPQLNDVIKFNNDFLKANPSLKVMCETRLNSYLNDQDKLFGIVDKIIYSDISKAMIIVDYKTGNTSFEEEKIEYGLSLQLPIYSYLVNKNFKDYQVVGIYIQNVLKDTSESSSDLRLNGITKNDLEVVRSIDSSLNYVMKSTYIYGLSLDKNHKIEQKKNILSEERWNEVVNKSLDRFNESVSNIKKGEFSISPVSFIDEQTSCCSYCKHKDICFKTYKDVRRVNLKKSGEDNA